MSIRPSIEVLRELDGKLFLEKLALSLHNATADVVALGKPAKIIVTLTLEQFSSKGMAEPVITIQAEINERFPKPDPNVAIFYIDIDGNPVVTQQRQRGLDLSIAVPDAQKEQVKNG